MPAAVPQGTAPPRPGPVVAVVGPSGVGKDTILGLAARMLDGEPAILFVRRAITRPAHDASEAFLPLSEPAFDRALDEGAFCFSWRANGLGYGLPRAMAAHLEKGGLAVVNGSRAAIPAMRAAFATVLPVAVTADPAVLAARLRGRGRETEAEITARLERATGLASDFEPALTLDNSGAPEEAATVLASFLRDLAGCDGDPLRADGTDRLRRA